MGNTGTQSVDVENDLTEPIVVSTYNGEDILIAAGANGIPYKQYTLAPGEKETCQAFAWAGAIHLKISYAGANSDIFKTVHGAKVKCSAIAANSKNAAFQDLVNKSKAITCTIKNDLSQIAIVRLVANDHSKDVTVPAGESVTCSLPNPNRAVAKVNAVLYKIIGDSKFVTNTEAFSVGEGGTVLVSSLKAVSS